MEEVRVANQLRDELEKSRTENKRAFTSCCCASGVSHAVLWPVSGLQNSLTATEQKQVESALCSICLDADKNCA
jgi:hypothetical protein